MHIIHLTRKITSDFFLWAKSRLFGKSEFRTSYFSDRTSALAAAEKSKVVAIVGTNERAKWAIFKCPCGCDELLALNLMKSHRPVWKLTVSSKGLPTLHPSIDATTCGAHFWLRDGKVIWAG